MALPFTNAKPYKFLALPAGQGSKNATHEWNDSEPSAIGVDLDIEDGG